MKPISKSIKVLIVVSIVAFACTYLYPPGGQTIRTEFKWFAPVQESSLTSRQMEFDAAAASRPYDFDLQLAPTEADTPGVQGVQDETTAYQSGFDNLVHRFPKKPAAYASSLSRDVPFLQRYIVSSESVEAFEIGAISISPGPPVPDDTMQNFIVHVETLAKVGEMYDPKNGFFPWMLAEAYFAGRRNDLALASLKRSSQDTIWRDYGAEDKSGQVEEAEIAGGDLQQISFMSDFQDAVIFDTSSASTAKAAVWQAIGYEEIGNFKKANEIRLAVMRVGALIRARSQSIGRSMQGVDVSFQAMKDANGVRDNETPPGPFTDPSQPDTWTPIVSKYDEFLLQHKSSQEEKWVEQQIVADKIVSSLYR
jgi:hypothetical protein